MTEPRVVGPRGRGQGRGRMVTDAAVFGVAWVALLALPAVAPSVAVSVGVSAQAARDLTPDESVRLGLEHSALIRAADAEAEAARAVQREARAGLLPAVRAQASYTHLGGDIPDAEFTLPGLDTTFTLLPIDRDRYHTEVGIEQALFAGGRLRHAARGAAREAVAAELRADQERADVALEIRRAYWTLYSARGALDATDAALAQMDEHLRDVRSRFEEGALLRSELLAAQTRRSEVALERVEAANAVRVAQLELNQLIGLPPATEVRPVAALELEPLPPDLAAFAAAATAAQPALQALGEQVAALRSQLAAARGSRLPELSFVSRYIYARPNPYVFTEQGTFRGTWEAGLAMRWSLWEGGAHDARAAQARERLAAAQARLDHAREQTAVDVARRYLEAQRATEAVGVAAENVEQAAESLRVTREQFAEGMALSAQVLEAERAYRAAQARQARAHAEYAIGRAALRHAMGEAW